MSVFDELFETLNNPVMLDGPPVVYQAYGAPPDNGVLVATEDPRGMVGWTAPAECWALAVVAPCTAWDTSAGPNERPGADQPRRLRDWRHSGEQGASGFWICTLLARDGRCRGRLHNPDGTTEDVTGEGEGAMMDAMKRALGRPTTPPLRSSAELVTHVWLASIGERLDARPDETITWAEVVSLHPVAQTLRDVGVDIDDPPRDISELLALSDVWSWEQLHRRAADPMAPSGIIDQELARWMDVGMFSRWILARLPPVPRQLAEVRSRLPRTVRRRLNSAVCHLQSMSERPAA